MKKLVATLALLGMAQSAHAIHIYHSSTCQAGQLSLSYDGPGSNYAVGGLFNFYVKGEEKGLLADELGSAAGAALGDDYGDDRKVEVIFNTISSKQVGETLVTPVDPKTCVGYDYDSEKSQSVDTVKIEQISATASKKMGLKAGDILVMNCESETNSPIKCDKDEE